MAERKRSFWGWTTEEWIDSLDARLAPRQHGVAIAYLLCGFSELQRLKSDHVVYSCLARKVFGREHSKNISERVRELLSEWGYRRAGTSDQVMRTIFECLLFTRSPHLRDITLDHLRSVIARRPPRPGTYCAFAISRVLAKIGAIPEPMEIVRPFVVRADLPEIAEGVPPEWARLCRRWLDTSTVSERYRRKSYYFLLNVGRWLANEHPEINSPADWTRDLATPKSVLAKIGPNPRIIADDVWAKLVWAGLNLTAEDLPKRGPFRRKPLESSYPVELCKALAVTWLFTGLRNNEILRLRLGCIRWQREDVSVPATDEILTGGAICMLDVPVNKTSTAFTKPVDPIVGEMISAWEKVRPNGVKLPDRKTGEAVDFLFLFRLTVVGKSYLNRVLIPTLCRKAGVPTADVRGNITSHRGRSTIASQLFNAKEPMTLFELQEWLGHSTPAATQHYAKITPTKLAKSYADAGYFARNLRAIEVLVDQQVVRSGRAATEPWKFYDLGHGYCTYDFFDQCPHRMACAKCSFYVPKGSSQVQLLQGKANLIQLRQEIPLNDSELAAVDDGVVAMEKLLERLADIPTPAGPTPRELGNRVCDGRG